MAKKTIWINAGELSGEMHGATLVKAFAKQNSEVHFVGMGGEMMQAAGVELLFRTEALSVMGFTEVLGHLPRIAKMLSAIRKSMEALRPAALIVIDAPDFNFRVISIARTLGIPVYYYISPKIWAWRQSRVHFIKKNVRKVISILPFEVPFYQNFGFSVDYVGNPLVDIVNYPSIASIEPQENTIGFLPGSRKKEVSSLMPEFGKAAKIVRSKQPDLSFVCMRAPNMEEDFLRGFWPQEVPLEVLQPENRWAAMRKCRMLVAASGTVTLESALAGVPTLVTYKVSPVSYLVGKALINVKYISLPNLIAGKEVFPEMVQQYCNAEPLAEKMMEWLPPAGDGSLQVIQKELDAVRLALGQPGAADRAAKCILQDLNVLDIIPAHKSYEEV